MLAQSLDELFEEGREEGRETAIQEILIRQLDRKFGLTESDKQMMLWILFYLHRLWQKFFRCLKKE